MIMNAGENASAENIYKTMHKTERTELWTKCKNIRLRTEKARGAA